MDSQFAHGATTFKAVCMNDISAAHLYGQFLKLAQSVSTLPAGLSLSPIETVLLQEIFLHCHNKQPLTVKQAIELKHLASPSTLHKKITHLRKLQLLETEHHGGDHRTKYLILTPGAMEHFHALGIAMQKALRLQATARSQNS